MKNNELDKFYTNPKICEMLVKQIRGMFQIDKYTIIEPCAGSGNFIDALSKISFDIEKKVLAFDIDPHNRSIKKQDFYEFDYSYLLPNKRYNMVITNPPFGKKCKTAIDFLNKSLEFADIVCMILPNTFNRFSIQKQIKETAKLVYSFPLEDNSFLVNDREYSVKCTFQIWTNSNVKLWLTDQRIKQNKLKIDGLELFIHNNTKKTLKYFDKDKYNWNFAIVRQGYYDYSEKITDPNLLKKNRQYLFVKTDNQYILDLINEIDFDKLARNNTTVLGFSNTDLINKLYELHIYKMLKKNKKTDKE